MFACRGVTAESKRDIGKRLQIMHRTELIHMGQYCLDSRGFWLKPLPAQQRVEPNQAATRAVQAVHFARQALGIFAVETIRNEQDNRALAEHATGPKAVEIVQGRADAGAARPVPDQLADPIRVSVNSLLMADRTLGGLAIDIIPTSTDPQRDKADLTSLWLVCTYQVRYRTLANDLETG